MIKKFLTILCLSFSLNSYSQTAVEAAIKVLCAPTDLILTQLGAFSSLTSFNDTRGNTWFIVKKEKDVLIMFSPAERSDITCVVTTGNTGVNSLL